MLHRDGTQGTKRMTRRGKADGWCFVVVTTTSQCPVKRVRVPVLPALAVLLFLGAGAFGLVRSVKMLGTYTLAKVGIREARRENKHLVKKLELLRRLTDRSKNRLHELIAFEDHTRLKFGMNPISEEVRMAGVGGQPSVEEEVLASLVDPQLKRAKEIDQSLSRVLTQADLQAKTFTRMLEHIRRQKDLWAQRPSIRPANGRITSGYGYRLHPFLQHRVFHKGLDIAAEVWTPVFSTADGIVSYVGFKHDFGNTVEVMHYGSGYETVYAHLQKAAVVEGHPVKRGELIGYLGSSGRSTGPHVHYEVRRQGNNLNPINFILPVDTMVD